MKVDIVRELISRLLVASAREGSLTESIALEVERRFRQEFAGEEFYIAKRPADHIDSLQESVTTAYLKGEPTGKIAAENGIGRTTLYRLLKR